MRTINFPKRPAAWTFFFFLFSVSVFAQTTAFTYQGNLTDGVNAANGTYQMQFALFTAVSGGTQIGSTITNNTVTVGSGVFTVSLDFGSSAFTGANRWLEVSVRKAAEPTFTLLSPRQPITSSPYSLKTLSATTADGLSGACVGCVTDASVANGISYSKLTGAPTSLPPGGTAGGDLTGTFPNPTIANSAVTSTKILDGTIVNADISTAAAITTSKISGLGTLATVTPTGTVNNSTFLRSDGIWQIPAAGVGNIFLTVFNASATTPSFASIGGGNTTIYNIAAAPMPAPCTFSDLYLSATPTSASPAADTITLTLYKNSAATAVVVTLTTSTTINTTTTVSNTGNSVAVAPGDTIAYQVAQSNTVPVIRLNASIRCQ